MTLLMTFEHFHAPFCHFLQTQAWESRGSAGKTRKAGKVHKSVSFLAFLAKVGLLAGGVWQERARSALEGLSLVTDPCRVLKGHGQGLQAPSLW